MSSFTSLSLAPSSASIYQDQNLNHLNIKSDLTIPVYSLTSYPNVLPRGSVMYNTDTGFLYVSNGTSWFLVTQGTSNAIPLNSISNPGAQGGGLLSVSILGASSVTTAGATTVAGNLYLYPGLTAAITGPFVIAGVTIAGDNANAATALAAQNDLTTAYVNAQSRPGALTLPGNVSGLTLLPGVYNNATSVLNSGVLTLNGNNIPNATWIFQIGSTLTTASGSTIVLTGGAQAKNIYWAVGSSATIGTTSTFYGIIMAQASISFAGANVFQGRALARTGAVTFAGAASTLTLP